MTAPERDVEARAREVWRKLPALVGAECVEEIASALRTERERALEECLAILSEELEDCYDADWGAHQERRLTVQAWLMNARARVSALKDRKP